MSAYGPDVLDGERGIPAPGLRRPNRARRAGVAGLILLAFALTGLTLWWQFGSADAVEQVQESERDTFRSSVPPMTFPDPMEVEPEPEPEPEQVVASIAEMQTLPPLPEQSVPAIPIIANTNPSPPPLPEEKRTVALDKSARPIALAQAPAGSQGAGEPVTRSDAASGGLFGVSDRDESGGAQAGQSELGARLTPTRLDATLAGRLSDRNLLVTRGTMIDCVLTTRIVTAVPGAAACQVTRNVYSDNGRVLLIERGSEITGEYRSNVQHGTRRVFVLWSRVKTPTGVVVDLDSPATDALGATGVPGEVDNHFWTRFGGAIMLSLVDDVAGAAATRAASDGDGTQVNVGGSVSSGSRVIEEVLSQTINIPPTVSVAQGARVGVFVARDLDFRGVYDVRAR